MSGGLVPSNVPSKWLWSPHAGVCAAVRRCARWVDKWCRGCTVGSMNPRDAANVRGRDRSGRSDVESLDLEVERAWLIECWRCSNDEAADMLTDDAARTYFEQQGWAKTEDGYQLCPQCRGVA